jgi:hypothetical protein
MGMAKISIIVGIIGIIKYKRDIVSMARDEKTFVSF